MTPPPCSRKRAGTRQTKTESTTSVLQFETSLVMLLALHRLFISTEVTLTVLRRNIAIYRPLAWKQTVVNSAFSDVVKIYRTSILKGVSDSRPARRVVLNSRFDSR